MKKRAWLLLLALVLVLGCMAPAVQAEGNLFFVAANDTIPTTLSVFPFTSGGTVYVPYQVFDASPCGVSSSYNQSAGTFVLFTRNKRLVFDYANNTVTTEKDVTTDCAVSFKNGNLFVPLYYCASYFGIRASMLENADGYSVLRFTDGSEVYDDALFLEKAENLIQYRVQQYETPAKTEPETPQKQEDEEPEQQAVAASVYLAFTCAESMRDSSTALGKYQLRGSFFLTAEEIKEDPALVRELYVAGQILGLTVPEDCEDCEKELQEANEALYGIIGKKTLLVLLPEGMKCPEGYRGFTIPAHTVTVEEAAEQTDTPSLIVCTGGASGVLYACAQNQITPQYLRENSAFL